MHENTCKETKTIFISEFILVHFMIYEFDRKQQIKSRKIREEKVKNIGENYEMESKYNRATTKTKFSTWNRKKIGHCFGPHTHYNDVIK